MNGKYLITTNSWFYAPDGKSYKAVWGEVEIVEDKYIGIKTNRNSTNWYAKVGSDDNHIIIAGCQIYYAIKCDTEPNILPVTDYNTDSPGYTEFKRPSSIWIVG